MRVSVYLFAHGARGEARVLRGDPQSVLQGCHAGLRDVEQYGLRGSGQGSALRVREGLRGGRLVIMTRQNYQRVAVTTKKTATQSRYIISLIQHVSV